MAEGAQINMQSTSGAGRTIQHLQTKPDEGAIVQAVIPSHQTSAHSKLG